MMLGWCQHLIEVQTSTTLLEAQTPLVDWISAVRRPPPLSLKYEDFMHGVKCFYVGLRAAGSLNPKDRASRKALSTAMNKAFPIHFDGFD